MSDQHTGTDAVVINDDVTSYVAQLKQQPGGDIVLHGGAGLVAELAQAELIW
jgi:dihydrofolate reductase